MKYARTPFLRLGVIHNFAVGLCFFLMTCLVSPLPIAQAAETLINFDNVADGEGIGARYPGVTFSNPLGGGGVGGVYARKGTGHVSSPADAAPSPPQCGVGNPP